MVTARAPKAAPAVDGRALSYAQNLEDYHLWLVFAGKERCRYVDIGGGHPIAGSVSFWFYERGWQGVVIEPQDDLAALHRILRPRDTLVEGVIGQREGQVDFYRVDRLHGFSTTVRQHAEATSKYGIGFERVRVPSLSLAELCRSHGLDDIDFMTIDVEGAERDVIASGDWRRHRPRIVVIEAITPVTAEAAWEDWEPLLLAQGYRFALFDSLNRFYVAEECPDLMARMPKEPAPWDSVRHLYEVGCAAENHGHPDHELACALARGFWASLPHLDERLIAALLRRGQDPSAALDREVGSEAFRLALGRIACNYDGGHVDE